MSGQVVCTGAAAWNHVGNGGPEAKHRVEAKFVGAAP